jgi:hypothetical protein
MISECGANRFGGGASESGTAVVGQQLPEQQKRIEVHVKVMWSRITNDLICSDGVVPRGAVLEAMRC